MYEIAVEGIPFYLLTNGNGYYAYAVGQHVDVNGSPLIVSFDPPIAPTVDASVIYEAIKAKLPVKPPLLP